MKGRKQVIKRDKETGKVKNEADKKSKKKRREKKNERHKRADVWVAKRIKERKNCRDESKSKIGGQRGSESEIRSCKVFKKYIHIKYASMFKKLFMSDAPQNASRSVYTVCGAQKMSFPPAPGSSKTITSLLKNNRISFFSFCLREKTLGLKDTQFSKAPLPFNAKKGGCSKNLFRHCYKNWQMLVGKCMLKRLLAPQSTVVSSRRLKFG